VFSFHSALLINARAVRGVRSLPCWVYGEKKELFGISQMFFWCKFQVCPQLHVRAKVEAKPPRKRGHQSPQLSGLASTSISGVPNKWATEIYHDMQIPFNIFCHNSLLKQMFTYYTLHADLYPLRMVTMTNVEARWASLVIRHSSDPGEWRKEEINLKIATYCHVRLLGIDNYLHLFKAWLSFVEGYHVLEKLATHKLSTILIRHDENGNYT
jgi:hypothetical protein